jgi:hypothetical protein
LELACSPPFDRDPVCYGANTWAFLMDSAECAAEWAELYTVKTEHQQILDDLAVVNQQLDMLCAADTTEVRCCPHPAALHALVVSVTARCACRLHALPQLQKRMRWWTR